jgi:serine protease Do
MLLTGLVSLLTLGSPLTSCNSEGDLKSQLHAETVSTVDRDSINEKITGSRRNAITNAVSKASPAVVGINVTEVREQRYYDPFEGFLGNDPLLQQFFGYRRGGQTRKYEVKGLGSGFLISSDGYVLTNDHVAGNAAKVIVTTTSGKQFDAEIVGTDKTSDVTLLKIDGKNLPYISLGNSDDLNVGEWAIAMGNPFGLFEINDKPTVTVGVISNTNVNLGLQENRNYRGMIQTDAAISSGNSGGPLLNAAGEVIGINSTIYSTAQGMQGAGSIGLGFAIPINKVKTIVEDLKKGRTIDRATGDLGMRVMPLNDELKQYFNIKGDDGVVVTDMLKNSPAAKAGLEVGDLILSADNERIRSWESLLSVIAEKRAGDVVSLKVLRNDNTKTIELKLAGRKS